MLWSRVTDRRLADPGYRVVNLTTFTNRCSDFADLEIVFKPNTDLAIWNYIAREIVAPRRRGLGVRRASTASSPPALPTSASACAPPTKFAFAAERDTQARQREVGAQPRGGDRPAAGPGRAPPGSRRSTPTSAGRHWLIYLRRLQARPSSPTPSTSSPTLAKGDPDEPLDSLQGEAGPARRPLRRPASARWCPSGPWASTSTPAAPGSTSRPTWSTC